MEPEVPALVEQVIVLATAVLFFVKVGVILSIVPDLWMKGMTKVAWALRFAALMMAALAVGLVSVFFGANFPQGWWFPLMVGDVVGILFALAWLRDEMIVPVSEVVAKVQSEVKDP